MSPIFSFSVFGSNRRASWTEGRPCHLWFCWSKSECACLVGPGDELGFATAILAGWSHRRSVRRIRSPVNLHCAAWVKILSFCNLEKVEHATSGRIGKTPPRRTPPRESRPPSEVKIAAEFPTPSQFPVVTRISTCRLSSFVLFVYYLRFHHVCYI
jgi:hypothetical protein